MSDRLGDRVQCPRRTCQRQVAGERGLGLEADAEDNKR
jgi:hypothetical protein